MARLRILLLLLLPARVAFAGDEADKAQAAALLAEGQTLADSGKYAEACPKFEESVKVHQGIGNRFNLADCWEKVGRTASAHALFGEIAAATHELGQTEREQAALARAEALSPKLTQLQIDVSSPPAGLELLRDGKLIAKDDWGKPLPLDPGKHELRATAPGKLPWSTELDVPAQPGTMALTLPSLEDEKKPAPVVAAPPPKKAPEPARPVEESGDGGRQVAALVLTGVGTVGLIGGFAMTAQYVGSHQDAKAVCPSGVGCTAQQIALHDKLVDDARTARTWAYVGVGVGTAALAGAAYLFFTTPSKKERPATAWLGADVFVAPGSVGGAIRGDF